MQENLASTTVFEIAVERVGSFKTPSIEHFKLFDRGGGVSIINHCPLFSVS